ncbi:MAG: TetR/AcrR family transcriptional regulator [Anaerolineales bacterium]|nr:TetR/AcrR family transcriptional regulator [Anaerolineales bacterium]
MQTPAPGKRRYEKNRQQILAAARAILLEEGLQAISMRNLAEKVDYSPAALYKYFSGKEEILENLRQEAWALMHESEPGLPPGLPLQEVLLRMARNYIDFATRYPQYYLLVMSPSDNIPGNFEEFLQDPNFMPLIQFTEEAVASGAIRIPQGYTPLHLALFFWFSVHAISTLKVTMMNNCQDAFETTSLEAIQMVMAAFIKETPASFQSKGKRP